jgi:ATP-dependent DNA ligase
LNRRRKRPEPLLSAAEVPCLRLVVTFDAGEDLLKAANRLQLEVIVSKRRSIPYRSGPCRHWRKIKTAAWKAANRERWRLFERR